MPEQAYNTSLSAEIYTQLYPEFMYAYDALRVREIVEIFGIQNSESILDIACGTGGHLMELYQTFPDSVGIDQSRAQLDIARQKLPDRVKLYQGDMRDFNLGRRFDVAINMFNSFAYLADLKSQKQGFRTMVDHVNDGGLVLVSAGLTPEQYRERPTQTSREVNYPNGTRIARHSMSTSYEDGLDTVDSTMRFTYERVEDGRVVTSELIEKQRTALLSHNDYLALFLTTGNFATVHMLDPPEGQPIYGTIYFGIVDRGEYAVTRRMQLLRVMGELAEWNV